MTARRAALALAAVVAVYLALLGWRMVLLIRDGSVVGVLFGTAVIVFPIIGAWLLWRELWFGLETQSMARELEAEGGLLVDDLPRRPSGHPERAAADAAFAERQAEAEAAPDDWRVWYRPAVAYDDVGDRGRARAAMARHLKAKWRGLTRLLPYSVCMGRLTLGLPETPRWWTWTPITC